MRDEIINYALYADDPNQYTVWYRDFDDVIECSLQEFLALETVPQHRIILIKKGQNVLYVKHGHCPICGKNQAKRECLHVKI